MNATPTPIAILTPDQVAAIARDAYEAGFFVAQWIWKPEKGIIFAA